MSIITKAAQIAEASTADLVETYNHFTGSSIKKFENRTIAERRVEMALLAATDRGAHAGVKPGREPEPLPAGALQQEAPAAGQEQPAAPTAPAAEGNPHPAGSKRAALWEQMQGKKRPEPRPRAEKRPPGEPRRSRITHVKLSTGISKLQAGSARAAVLDGIRTLAAAAPRGVVGLAELAAHVGIDVRGHVQKLIVVKHVVACDAEGQVNE